MAMAPSCLDGRPELTPISCEFELEIEACRAGRIRLLHRGVHRGRPEGVPPLRRRREPVVLRGVGGSGSLVGGRFGDAPLDHDDLSDELEMNGGARIRLQIAQLARARARGEEECAVPPDAPDRPDMWAARLGRGREPVVPRLAQPLLDPGPRKLRRVAHSAITTGTGAGEATASGVRASTANDASTIGPTRSAKRTVPTPKVPPSAMPAASAQISRVARTIPMRKRVRLAPTSMSVSRGPAPRSAQM